MKKDLTMTGIALVTIISIFSVVIPIQSRETTVTYNYDNFGKLFPQGHSGVDHFHVYKYKDIDTIFDTAYRGTNIGGAFLVEGDSAFVTNTTFPGYVVKITATFYCGSTKGEVDTDSLYLGVHWAGYGEHTYLCEKKGWNYDYTWTPTNRYSDQVSIRC